MQNKVMRRALVTGSCRCDRLQCYVNNVVCVHCIRVELSVHTH